MYYDDLSGDDRDDESSSSSSSGESFFEDGDAEDEDRVILHADVDCFYCQCEAIDRNIAPDRPFAITQKHIIVTCNYVARRQYGLSKLQSIQEAVRKCPTLLLIDGSDLQRYRQQARRIYQCFRSCLLQQPNISVCKGSMDEMMADLTNAPCLKDGDCNMNNISSRDFYIYGNDGDSSTIVLTEDQSGVETRVVPSSRQAFNITNAHSRLLRAAHWVHDVRQQILRETGFTLTLGISSNPLLAKLASGLRKPATVNLLYKKRAAELLQAMPLRKLPGVGSRTCKALEECLAQAHGDEKPPVWTCRDLLLVPSQEITRCLENIAAFHKSSQQQCTMILRMCRGQDDSLVVDDHGGLPKTVSVENSFRRGTVCSLVSVEEAMETLYERLPIIYNNRTDYSDRPEKAFPRTLRLTIRNVDSSLSKSKRRPFATRSKQTILSNGAHFHQLSGEGKLPLMLKILVQPLMRSLLVNESINVTRINVAITDFQDISVAKGPSTFISSHSQRSPKPSQVRQVELPSMLHKKRSKRIDDYFAPRKKHA